MYFLPHATSEKCVSSSGSLLLPVPRVPPGLPPVIEAYQAGMYSMARLNRTAARLMTKYGKFSVLVSLCNWWRDCAIMLSYCAMPLPCCEITLPCRCPLCNRCDRIWHTWPCSQPSQGPEGRCLLQAPLPSKYAYLQGTPFILHTSAVCSYACLPWNLPHVLCIQYHQYYCDWPLNAIHLNTFASMLLCAKLNRMEAHYCIYNLY